MIPMIDLELALAAFLAACAGTFLIALFISIFQGDN